MTTQHQKGQVAGAVWAAAELLRTHGDETVARELLRASGHPTELILHGDPIDLVEIFSHPWVAEPLRWHEHHNRGKVEFTRETAEQQAQNGDATSIFVEQDKEILEVSKHLLEPRSNRKGPPRGCKTCRHAKWSLTPTGKIKKGIVGRCLHPIPEMPSLPDSIEIRRHRNVIWPQDGHRCPTWEPTPKP